MRSELLESANALPSTFRKILAILNDRSLLQAIEYYSNFVRDAHTGKDVGSLVLKKVSVDILITSLFSCHYRMV